MRLPEMTIRRWMVVVAVLALTLVAVTRIVVPISWDLEGSAEDDHWLKWNIEGRADDDHLPP